MGFYSELNRKNVCIFTPTNLHRLRAEAMIFIPLDTEFIQLSNDVATHPKSGKGARALGTAWVGPGELQGKLAT